MNHLQLHDMNVQTYCDRHNYTYIKCKNEPINEMKIPVYWYKLLKMRTIIQDYDYVMWLDSDTVISDQRKRLESIVSKKIYIFIGTDYGTKTLCAGIFIIKNSRIGINFLDKCLDKLNDPECFNEDRTKCLGPWAGSCYKQGQMSHWIKRIYKNC